MQDVPSSLPGTAFPATNRLACDANDLVFGVEPVRGPVVDMQITLTVASHSDDVRLSRLLHDAIVDDATKLDAATAGLDTLALDTPGGEHWGPPRSVRRSDAPAAVSRISINVHNLHMALSIKDPEADRLARELAARTGESLTEAVLVALRERLARETGRTKAIALREELAAIRRRCAALPVVDNRSADEILGYDDRGLPA